MTSRMIFLRGLSSRTWYYEDDDRDIVLFGVISTLPVRPHRPPLKRNAGLGFRGYPSPQIY